METSADFHMIESNTGSSLAGRPAYNLVFTDLSADKVRIKAIKFGTIINGNLYSFSYYADTDKYSHYLPLVQRMIESLKIVNVL